MSKHYDLNEADSFSIPFDCIAKVYKRGRKMGDFSYVYHYALEEAGSIAKDATKTLIQLMAKVDFQNVVYVDTFMLAARIGITRTAVQQHMSILRKSGIIIPHEDASPDSRTIMKWRLCPFLGWRGTGSALEVYISTLPVNHPFFKFADPGFMEALKEEIKKEAQAND